MISVLSGNHFKCFLLRQLMSYRLHCFILDITFAPLNFTEHVTFQYLCFSSAKFIFILLAELCDLTLWGLENEFIFNLYPAVLIRFLFSVNTMHCF
ncbi:hypothetical protein Solca_0084 [Solitalea canadensis DSM 3403]|uniref:Uncharacterized protein n=1 Tax=Solitalea canadensis (strain ATCC 29591 / DSM 3403 / JCM 21819 / LMG 8368 / NBRC 15130 / NCIMB 12057 / USAM 9D) TaxID=929556 RepID=H8KT57_SOLCM|nr:hypothetical protein Solca_0084 [Solitalea canadensis DSM 3403]